MLESDAKSGEPVIIIVARRRRDDEPTLRDDSTLEIPTEVDDPAAEPPLPRLRVV